MSNLHDERWLGRFGPDRATTLTHAPADDEGSTRSRHPDGNTSPGTRGTRGLKIHVTKPAQAINLEAVDRGTGIEMTRVTAGVVLAAGLTLAATASMASTSSRAHKHRAHPVDHSAPAVSHAAGAQHHGHKAGHSHPATSPHRTSGESGPGLKSNAFYVLDESSSSVMLAKQADVASPIASITKLMTALVVVEAGQPLDEMITVSPEDRGDTAKTSTSRLEFGTTLSRADLLHLALMSSENRAAHALGRTYPGGLAACVAAMNAKAKALGMTSAHFVEPTGLESDNVASPEDLAKLVRAASASEVIQRYSTDKSYTVPVRRHSVEFHNTDALVRNPTWNIIVQKTGYIAEAGRCLVMKTVFEGRSIIIVLLDSAGKYTRVADAQRVRRWLETRLGSAGENSASHRS
jgi:serine-type D-Ala-D-Ala endopeptidase (penicillin-binding protein 7)